MREEELWILFSTVSRFCVREMEKWDISFDVKKSSESQRDARAKA